MRILVVEDDPTIARELSLRWRAQGWTVFECSTLAEASLIGDADLVVLDLQLPDGDGLQWLQGFRARDSRTPVLVLTARDEVADRVKGLRAGADDYLVKPFAVDELDARIQALRRRLTVQHGEHIEFGPLALVPEEGRLLLRGVPLQLHPREFEVMAHLVRRAPRVVAKRFLIDVLSERNLEVGDSAIEVYVSRLRRKLAGSGVAVHTVRGFGYRLGIESETEVPSE